MSFVAAGILPTALSLFKTAMFKLLESVLLPILFLSGSSYARLPQTLPRPANPYLDPAHDPYNPLRYIASNTLTAVAFSLYMIVALYMTFATIRWGSRYMLSMVIGAYTFSIGVALRFGLHKHPESKGIYIAEYLFVVLSPCAFIAADYMLISRLSRYLRAEKLLPVPPNKITKVFITSDISTFLIQALGGSIAVSANDLKHNLVGAHIFLAGLVAQLLSFATFTCVFVIWLSRLRKQEVEAGNMEDRMRRSKTICIALLVSCLGILTRSVYRVAELAQGFHGQLATTEKFFYACDTYPLFLAVAIFVPFWPGRFIPDSDLKEESREIREGGTESPRSDVALEKASPDPISEKPSVAYMTATVFEHSSLEG